MQGMEYLDAIEKAFKDLPKNSNKDAVIDAIADYDFYIGGVRITREQLMKAAAAGILAARAGPWPAVGASTLTLLQSVLGEELKQRVFGGGENSGPPNTTAGKRSLKSRLKDEGLPIEGTFRYVAPKNYHPSQPLPKGPNKGFIDQFGNEWVKGESRTAGEDWEWDVQIGRHATEGFKKASRDGRHVNISLKGRVTH